MKTRILCKIALAFGLTLGLPSLVLAQATPPPPSTSAPESVEIITLETFTVNTEKDNGYIASDSLAGGRQALPIRVTPTAMSSITGQFIKDLNLTNMQDALKWSLSTVPTNDRNGFSGGSAGSVFNFWSISTRGGQSVQGGNPPTKNYFPTYMNIDTYNVDRIEFAQGPNSILFGIGDIGGAVTAYTKRARFDKEFTDLGFSFDSYGGHRGTIDANQVMGDLAIRVNAVAADHKGWRDGDSNTKLGATLDADWKFNNGRSHLRFEIEGWTEEKSIYGASYQDVASLWNGTTAADTWGAPIAGLGDNPQTTPGAPGVRGMSDWGLPTYPVIVAGADGGIQYWAAGVKSMGTNNVAWGAYLRPESFNYDPTGGTPIMALPSREFAVAPSDGYVKPENLNMTLTYEQRINEHWDFQVAGYRYEDHVYAINFEGGNSASYDLNRQLPNGAANPNFGKLHSDFFLGKQVQNHRVNELRGQLSYRFDAEIGKIPLNQVFSVSAGQQETDYDARQYNAQDISTDTAPWTDANWTSKLVWGRLYWDNPDAALNVPDTVRYSPLPFNWFDFDSTQKIKFAGFFSQSRLWDDRVNVTLGARHDSYDVSKVGLRGPTNVPVVSDGDGNTYSAGVVAYITEWLGVLANYSENYQPAAGGLAPTVYGEVLGASVGEGKNIGLRVSTKDGKYYASLTYYQQEAQDVIGGNSPGFQGIWDEYFTAGGLETDIGPAGQVTGDVGSYKAAMQYVDTYDVKYDGIEFEVTANPTRNIRLQMHYSAPNGERTNNGPNGVRYFNEHLATWQAIAGGTSTEAQRLASTLANVQNDLAIWAQPTLAGAVVKSMWNVFGTYSFMDGSLKGLDVGIGASMTGKRQINETQLTTSYTTTSLLVGYSWKFGAMGRDVPARVQLNLDNLFDNDTLVFQNYNGITPMDYNFIPPRKATVSVRFEF